jgi:hypothetical protein
MDFRHVSGLLRRDGRPAQVKEIRPLTCGVQVHNEKERRQALCRPAARFVGTPPNVKFMGNAPGSGFAIRPGALLFKCRANLYRLARKHKPLAIYGFPCKPEQ